MKAIFNSRSIDANKPLLKVTNRAFCYGDGLFETIVTGQNRINLLPRHLERLQLGASAIGIAFPQSLNQSNLDKWIDELIKENDIKGNYRIRIHLWRDAGGQYTPKVSSSSFLVEVNQNISPMILGNLKIDLNEEYVNVYSPISRFKTKNALKYIMLGKAKEAAGLDDIIILDKDGHLSESFSSSLFWIKDGVIFTPALETGCVSGVMRSFVIDYLASTNKVHEVLSPKSALENCDSIFTTNGAGIRWFNQYRNQKLQSPENLLARLIKRLQQP